MTIWINIFPIGTQCYLLWLLTITIYQTCISTYHTEYHSCLCPRSPHCVNFPVSHPFFEWATPSRVPHPKRATSTNQTFISTYHTVHHSCQCPHCADTEERQTEKEKVHAVHAHNVREPHPSAVQPGVVGTGLICGIPVRKARWAGRFLELHRVGEVACWVKGVGVLGERSGTGITCSYNRQEMSFGVAGQEVVQKTFCLVGLGLHWNDKIMLKLLAHKHVHIVKRVMCIIILENESEKQKQTKNHRLSCTIVHMEG